MRVLGLKIIARPMLFGYTGHCGGSLGRGCLRNNTRRVRFPLPPPHSRVPTSLESYVKNPLTKVRKCAILELQTTAENSRRKKEGRTLSLQEARLTAGPLPFSHYSPHSLRTYYPPPPYGTPTPGGALAQVVALQRVDKVRSLYNRRETSRKGRTVDGANCYSDKL